MKPTWQVMWQKKKNNNKTISYFYIRHLMTRTFLTFVWKACSDILPTRANLFRRKIPIDPLCTVCGQVDETMTHALWECPLARNVWALVRGKLQKCGAAAPNFLLLARQMVAKLTGPELELWAMVSWSIWNARNRYHFEAKQSQPSDILCGATQWRSHMYTKAPQNF